MIGDQLQTILLCGLVGLVTNYIGWRNNFFTLPLHPPPHAISWRHLIAVFSIYLATVFGLTPLCIQMVLIFSAQQSLSVSMEISLRFLILGAMMVALVAYCRTQGRVSLGRVWKTPLSSPTSWWFDWGIGMATWLMAFPVVAFVGEILDLILYLTFQLESYEQVAVRYLKTTLQSPAQMRLALISIVAVAPVVEEFLFRGALQNYLKGKMGVSAAVITSAACFGLSHFSISQGVGNVSLLPSLFTFGCFLGFVYERQRSLFASIGLHMAFNLASTLRIILDR